MDDIKITTLNGHPILKDMPAPCLFETEGGFNVRIALPYEKSEMGVADIYVHKGCVTWRGDRYVDAKFDVLLVDSTYKLYYPVKDPETGLYNIVGEEGEHSVEEIYDMAMKAKQDYLAHPIKLPKPNRHSMARFQLPEEWATVHPANMLTPGYVQGTTLPDF